MRHLDEIIVHCAATPPDWLSGKDLKTKIKTIRAWHVNDRGWSDIGYHFVIDRDGAVGTGRSVAVAGAHTSGHNANSIGICLLGGKGSWPTDRFSDHYTPEQAKALYTLIEELRADHPTIVTVNGHNQYSSKGCPGFNVPEWYMGWRPVKPSSEGGGLAGLIAALLSAIARLFNGSKG